jgi:hypothetical protein
LESGNIPFLQKEKLIATPGLEDCLLDIRVKAVQITFREWETEKIEDDQKRFLSRARMNDYNYPDVYSVPGN